MAYALSLAALAAALIAGRFAGKGGPWALTARRLRGLFLALCAGAALCAALGALPGARAGETSAVRAAILLGGLGLGAVAALARGVLKEALPKLAWLPVAAAVVAFLILLSQCRSKPGLVISVGGDTRVESAVPAAGDTLEESRTFFAMDTVMTVTAEGATRSVMDACEAEVARLEGLFSVTRPDSEIAKLNAEGRAALSEDAQAVLSCALETAELTDGALDVTLYPVVRAWGFTTGDYRVPSDEEISELLGRVDWRRVTLEDGEAALPEGAMADLGAVAKGYASDRLAALLREAGLGSALIDLGGNVVCVGAKPDGSPWRIGIRDPEDPDSLLGLVAVSDRAVVTSGCYERFFTGEDGAVYGHIFDPATGRPAESGLSSVTVISSSGLRCDALTTALYVLGAERSADVLARLDGVEAVLASEDGELWITPGLRDIFTARGRWESAPIHWL